MEEIEQELLRDPTATLGLGGSDSTPKQQVQKAPQVQEQEEEEEDSDFLDTIGDIALAPFRGLEGTLNGVYNLADMAMFDVLPDLDTRFLGRSKTTAGSLVEGISQFAFGFVPIFGAAGKIGALAKAGTVARGVAAGAVTDFVAFKGQEDRLSNLIQQFPELQNPVTEFLAHDANESEVEGRLKNVLEGLILEGAIGGTVTLFMKSLRALKAGKKVRDVDGGGADEVNKATSDSLEGGKAFQIKGYHGSLQAQVVFEEGFDPTKLGSFTGAASAKEGFFFARKPKTARKYSGTKGPTGRLFEKIVETFEGKTPAVKPIKDTYYNYRDALQDPRQKQGLELVEEKLVESGLVNTKGKWNDKVKQGDVDKFLNSLDKTETQEEFIGGVVANLKEAFNEAVKPAADKRGVIEATLSMNNPKIVDFKGADRTYADYVKAIKEAKKKGHDGAILKNTFDPMSDDIYVVFDPKQIGMNKIIDTSEEVFPAPGVRTADYDAELGRIGPELKKDFYDKTLVEGVSSRMQTGKPMTAREAIQDLSDRTNGNLGQYSPIVKKLLALGKDTGIDAKLEERSFASDVPTGLKRGSFYESGKRRIVLDGQSSSVKENPIYNLLHESTHAVTVDNVNKYYDSTTFKNIDVNDIATRAKAIDKVLSNKSLPKPVAEMFRMFKKADAMRDEIAAKGELVGTDGKPDLYWIKNPAEFMSMAFSDPQLQQALKGIQYTPKMTMWEKVVNTIKSFFGRGVSTDLADNIVSRVGEIAEMKLPSQRGRGVDMMPGGPELIDEFDRDIIDEWFEHLDEDALHDEVLGALDQFKPKYRSFLKALAKEDWLGFDYPSQAVNEFVRNPNIYEQFEISPALKGAATKLVNAGFRGDIRGRGVDFAPEGRAKIETDPEWQQWTNAVLKGEKPTLPRLEVVGDIDSAHKILTEKYKKNPELLKNLDETPNFHDEDLNTIVKDFAQKSIKDQKEIALNAEIFRDILTDSTEKLMKIVDDFDKTESIQSEAALRNQLSEVVEIYDYYRQMGKETALTLAMRRSKNPISRKIGLETSEMQNSALVKEFLNNNSGGMSAKKAVKLIKDVYNPTNPDKTLKGMLNVAKKTQGNKLLDATIEYWTNSILSGPRTQAVNFLGNLMTQVLTSLEMTAGAAIQGNMPLAKAAFASVFDVILLKEAWSSATKTLITGKEVLDIGSRSFESNMQSIGKAIDFSKEGNIDKNTINLLGSFINLPARGLLGGDELFKQLSFRRAARLKATMDAFNLGLKDSKEIADYVEGKIEKIVTTGGQVMSQESLIREGTAQADKLGLIGKPNTKKRADYIKKYVDDNFDEEASALAKYSIEEARYYTFTRELEEKTIAKFLQNATNNIPMLKFVLPFVRTPANILNFALERTPFAASVRIPGTNKIMSFPGLRSEALSLREGMKSNDPLLRAQTTGKLITSVTTLGLFLDMVTNNNAIFPVVTGAGPRDDRQREMLEQTGWRPYSIKIGDTYYSYKRLDPIATLLGISADMNEMMKEADQYDEEGAELLFMATATALARNVSNKSFLAGVQMWSEAMNDPDRFGKTLGKNYAGSFVPNVLSQMQDYDKQSLREARTWADAAMKKLPGGRDMLDPQRNLLGEEKIVDYGTTGFINPVATSKDKSDIVLEELASLKHGFRHPSSRILQGNLDLLDYVNEQGRTAHDRRLDLLQTVRVRGRTLRQTLTKLIQSSKYQKLVGFSDEIGLPSPRVQEITKVLRKFKDLANREMYKEFPELASQKNNITRALQLNKQGVNKQEVLELLSQTN